MRNQRNNKNKDTDNNNATNKKTLFSPGLDFVMDQEFWRKLNKEIGEERNKYYKNRSNYESKLYEK